MTEMGGKDGGLNILLYKFLSNSPLFRTINRNSQGVHSKDRRLYGTVCRSSSDDSFVSSFNGSLTQKYTLYTLYLYQNSFVSFFREQLIIYVLKMSQCHHMT